MRNIILTLVVIALCVGGFSGGCSAGNKRLSDDDDSVTSTGTGSSSGGSTAASGGGGSGATGGSQAGGSDSGGGGNTASGGSAAGGTATGGAGGTPTTGGAGGVSPCGYGSPVCLIAAWDFDSGCPSGWTTSGTNSDWACGIPNFSDGPPEDCEGSGNTWGTGLQSKANVCQNSYLISPEVDLSAYQGQTVLLGFYHWYDFRECAAGAVLCNVLTDWMSYSGGQVQVNSGGGWTKLTPQGGYETGGKTVNCSSSDGGSPPCNGVPCDIDEQTDAYTCGGLEQQWHQALVDISSYTTSTFRARFVYGSHENDIIAFKNRAGWYVDNIAILIPGPCP